MVLAAVAIVTLTVAGTATFWMAWQRPPWSEQPSSFGVCGTTFWPTGLTGAKWADELAQPVPGGPQSPLREVGSTGGWWNARTIFAPLHSGTRRNDGCGDLVFLQLASGQLMVYGADNVDYTSVG